MIHKKILKWGWYDDLKTKSLFLHLLLLASHKESEWHGVKIVPGQVITSLPHLSKELGIGVQSIRTSLVKLKSTGELTDKSSNKYRIITILNWVDYQKPTGKLTVNQQTTNRQLTSSKEYKEIKEDILSFDKDNEPLKIMEFWNGCDAAPPGVRNISATKKLLPKCQKITADIQEVVRVIVKKGNTIEDIQTAIKNYTNEIVNRDSSKGTYHLHRFSLYDFLKQKNGFTKYFNA